MTIMFSNQYTLYDQTYLRFRSQVNYHLKDLPELNAMVKKIHNFLNNNNVLDIQTDNQNNYEHFTYHNI